MTISNGDSVIAEAEPIERAVSIYSSREEFSVLQRTVQAAVAACGNAPSVVDIIVNGNERLAEQIASIPAILGPSGPTTSVRLWYVRLGDKAQAWNQYVHDIAPSARRYFFIDGYARLDPDAIDELTHAIDAAPGALAGTGVPDNGAGARAFAAAVTAEGGIHGNFYALTDRAMKQLRALPFRLPLGIYRTDPTLGAALSFGLGLFAREWRPTQRIVACSLARWSIKTLSWWNPQDINKQRKRLLRQAQGDLENRAVQYLFSRRRAGFNELPSTTAALVEGWIKSDAKEAESYLEWHWLRRRALSELLQPRDWSAAATPPHQVSGSILSGSEGAASSVRTLGNGDRYTEL